MSTIVATGPVSSGTRMIYYIIEHWLRAEQDPRDLVHWSQPNWQTFWTHDEWPDDTQFVVIVRRPDCSTLSAWDRGHGLAIHERVGFNEWQAREPLPEGSVTHADMLEWWDKAIGLFAAFPPERTYWVSYEAMIWNPPVQARGIARFLGFDRDDLPFPIRDQNEKWLKMLPQAASR